MIICICANISDKKISKCLTENVNISSVRDLRQHLPVCQQCAKCKKEVSVLVQKHVEVFGVVENE